MSETARAQSSESFNLIADLDDIHAGQSAIRCNKKDYILSPVTLEMACEVDAQNRSMRKFVSTITTSQPSDMETVYLEYFSFFQIVCKNITLDDVKQMTVVQVNRLYKEMSRHVYTELSGKTLIELDLEEKKKIQLNSNSN